MSQNFSNTVIIALGANIAGAWGAPAASIAKCLRRLAEQGLGDLSVSPIYKTKAHGSIRQPDYLNLVVQAKCAISPRQAIELFKQNERCSGRRLLGRNAPRPLDIDLLDYAGRIVNWKAGYPRPKLVLPHPLLATRPFVLAPLADLAPQWRHPINGMTARQLLNRHGGLHQVLLRREISRVDLEFILCDGKRSCAQSADLL